MPSTKKSFSDFKFGVGDTIHGWFVKFGENWHPWKEDMAFERTKITKHVVGLAKNRYMFSDGTESNRVWVDDHFEKES
jgi:hypothetical protein